MRHLTGGSTHGTHSQQCHLHPPCTLGPRKSTSKQISYISPGRPNYGIEILNLQEICGYEPPTAIANAPAFVKGVINLRGVIVPILDPRIKFQIIAANYDGFTVAIILNVADRVVGVVVDSVSDVLTLAADAIRPTPEFASSTFDTKYITGLGTVDERMLILLDIEKLMTSTDMALVETSLH